MGEPYPYNKTLESKTLLTFINAEKRHIRSYNEILDFKEGSIINLCGDDLSGFPAGSYVLRHAGAEHKLETSLNNDKITKYYECYPV